MLLLNNMCTMIEKNELKKGNYVKYDNCNYQIKSDKSWNTLENRPVVIISRELKSDDRNDYGIIKCENLSLDIYDANFDETRLSGILIDTAINYFELLNGAHSIDELDVPEYNIPEYDLGNNIILKKRVDHYFILGRPDKPLYYLHELQNLYKDLTNKDLIIEHYEVRYDK